MSRHSLMLDSNWDITLNGAGRIAQTTGKYAIAQNVANAVRLFTRDAFFDQEAGIPHFDIELGHNPPLSVLRARIKAAALAVDGVVSAVVDLDTPIQGRTITGSILLTTEDNETATIEF